MIQDIAKELRAEPLLELRRMRAFVNEHSFEAMNERCRKLGEAAEKIQTPEEETKWESDWIAFSIDDEMKKFYNLVLMFAELAERKEKGGGAALYSQHEKEIRRAEDMIRKGYRMINEKWEKIGR